MEAARNLITSSPLFPPPTHLKTYPSSSSSSSSVLMFHEQAACALAFLPTTSLDRHFPTSVLLQEQHEESKPFLHIVKEDKTSKVTLDRRQMESGFSEDEENNNINSDQYLKDFQYQILTWPDIWYLLPPLQAGEILSLSSTMLSVLIKTKKLMEAEPHNAVDSQLFGADFHEVLTPRSRSTSFTNFPLYEEKTVRSTQLLKRQFKKRRVPKPKTMVQEYSNPGRAELQRKISQAFDTNNPLRLFLRGKESKQLLTVKEESKLIVHIQDLTSIEEVKSRLWSQFDREPTLAEWAAAIGLSSQDLKWKLVLGNSSREKLICANFRMVVHIAKQYQGRGLNLQDLLQEGSMGLMRSVEKFKPHAGCRFATYAYWWIRQAIGKAIFQHSRTIRLPDNVYSLLYKVTKAKRLCIQEGNHQPTKEEIAAHVGITVERLDRLLFSTRMPLSMQQPEWTDQNTTFQEITPDTAIEIPTVCVAKQLMRQHIRNLLSILIPKERKIIRLRYGIGGSIPKSFSEIGAVLGLTKERVRQLETRAIYKLKQRLSSQGLGAYADFLI